MLRENTSRAEPVELQRFLTGGEKFTIPRCPELVENKADTSVSESGSAGGVLMFSSPLLFLCTLLGVHLDVYGVLVVGCLFVSRERCFWVSGVLSRFLMGGPVRFDLAGFVAAVVEVSEGGYRCRLCGGVFKVNGLIAHLRRRHCSELVELWSSLRPRPLYSGGGGRASFMSFMFKCRVCGWGLRLELPCNAGPPSVRRKLLELLGSVIPRCCPSCGRVFDLSRVEFGFAGERGLPP